MKPLVSFLVIFLYCSNIFSQSLYFDLGFNFSKVVESNNQIDEIFQRSAAFGFGYARPINKKFGFSFDTQYSIKGYRIRGAHHETFGFLPDGFTNFNYHYLDLIPAIHTHVYKGLNIVTGANVGFKIVETFNGEKTEFPRHRTLDLGIVGGFSYNFDRAFVRILANRGLLNPAKDLIISDINEHEVGLLNYKSINFQITLGITIFEFDNKLRSAS